MIGHQSSSLAHHRPLAWVRGFAYDFVTNTRLSGGKVFTYLTRIVYDAKTERPRKELNLDSDCFFYTNPRGEFGPFQWPVGEELTLCFVMKGFMPTQYTFLIGPEGLNNSNPWENAVLQVPDLEWGIKRLAQAMRAEPFHPGEAIVAATVMDKGITYNELPQGCWGADATLSPNLAEGYHFGIFISGPLYRYTNPLELPFIRYHVPSDEIEDGQRRISPDGGKLWRIKPGLTSPNGTRVLIKVEGPTVDSKLVEFDETVIYPRPDVVCNARIASKTPVDSDRRLKYGPAPDEKYIKILTKQSLGVGFFAAAATAHLMKNQQSYLKLLLPLFTHCLGSVLGWMLLSRRAISMNQKTAAEQDASIRKTSTVLIALLFAFFKMRTVLAGVMGGKLLSTLAWRFLTDGKSKFIHDIDLPANHNEINQARLRHYLFRQAMFEDGEVTHRVLPGKNGDIKGSNSQTKLTM